MEAIGVRYHHISDLSASDPPYHLFFSLFSGPLVRRPKKLVGALCCDVLRAAYLCPKQPRFQFSAVWGGRERVRWHFRSHTVHMTSDTLLSDVRYQIYVFPETGCFCIPGKSWNSLMWQFRFRQEPPDPPVSVERYEICVFLETCGFLD